MSVVDLTGRNRVVFNPEHSEGLLDISSIEQGIYIVRISTINGEHKKKIVIK